jgi:cysteine desulfurase/selenocysteine lyase
MLDTKNKKEIILTRGTTEAINLVMSSWGRTNVKAGGAVVVTRMEHHSNFVPWQTLALEKQAEFRIVELTPDYRIDLNSFSEALKGKPQVVAFTYMSNALGTVNPVKEMAELAKNAGAVVVLDCAQATAHLPMQLDILGPVDFVAFSGHKMFGPTGIGALWGREALLQKMPPYQYGGDMILNVQDKLTTWNDLPFKFEAGTPNISGTVGLSAALDYLSSVGLKKIREIENELTQVALGEFKRIQGLHIIGPPNVSMRGPVVSFTLDKVHPHDLATFLDMEGIAVRAGHHCAQPLMNRNNLTATTRASFSFYNTVEEIALLSESIRKAQRYFT